jgi:hypothetical protein
MKSILSVLLAIVAFAIVGAAPAAPADYKLTTQANDPLARELEQRLRSLAGAAAMGDLAGARALRPAAVIKALPTPYTREMLKTEAALIAPSLTGYRFVQMESDGRFARIVYEKREKDRVAMLVQTFVKEGDWKVGANHKQAYVGATPPTAKIMAEALRNPGVQLP